MEKEGAYIPFLKEDGKAILLYMDGETAVELPVLSYTREVPVLREEYDNYALVQFIPLWFWKAIAGQMTGAKQTTYIRLLGQEGAGLYELNRLEAVVRHLLEQSYEVEGENRIQEKITNNNMIKGEEMILGAFCGLLTAIGIANVFSNTLGFLRQRRREFAQYLSIGMTPANMRKMFAVEAFVIAGRPIAITLPLTVAAVAFMIGASHLDPKVFLEEAPFLPILVFALLIIIFVSLAYCVGGKRILKCDLNETLKDDTII